MKKLIIAALFTMFAATGAAASRADDASIERPTAVVVDTDRDVDAAEPGDIASVDGEAQPYNPACQAQKIACKADCMDLIGNAKGACLRACDVEYQECMGL